MTTKSALLGVWILGAVAARAGALGLVENSGFEEVDPKGWAKGWTQWPVTLSAGASVAIDGNISRSGTRSLRISQTRQDSYSRADQIVAVTPQKTYMISCWIRGQDLDPAASAGGVRLFVGRNGTGHPFRTLGPGREARGTFPWTRYEIGPVPVGDQSKLAFLPYLHKTTGTVWFDDIEIVELTPDLAQRIEQLRVRNILLRDLELVDKACREAGDDEARQQAAAMRERVSKDTALPTDLDRRHGPPFFGLHREIYAVLGAALERRHPGQGLVVWPAEPFARQSHLACPPGEPEQGLMDVHALRGDREQVALNLTNATTEDMAATLSLSGPAAGLQVVWREVIPVELQEGAFIDDALPKAAMGDGRARIVVPPGMTRQAWLEIHAPKAAGTLAGMIRVEWANGATEVPLTVRVHDVSYPPKWPIRTFPYAYLPVRPLTKDRIPIAAADLAAHHTNAMMPHSWVEKMPTAVFAEDGTLLPERMDWSAFDVMLAYSGHVDTFVFLIPPARMKLMCVPEGEDAPFGGPVWERRACEWLRAVIAGLRERGIGHDRMLWSADDEPSDSTVDLVVTMGGMFHRADPNIRVYNNFYSSATPDDVRKMDSVVDVWAPHLDCLDEKFLTICTQRKRELWAYRVQSKGTAPTSVRGAFWRLFAVGATGYSFWTYTDTSADPWTPYDIDRHDYHVVYNGDPDEMIPSKRWEAWREGVEDYTLLHMLREQRRDIPPDPNAEPVSEHSDASRIRHARTRVLQALANPDR